MGKLHFDRTDYSIVEAENAALPVTNAAMHEYSKILLRALAIVGFPRFRLRDSARCLG
jgi:hypothetical protein